MAVTEDGPIFLIGFTPRGACRGRLQCNWPEGTAQFFTLTEEPGDTFCNLEGRDYSLEQFARLQLGIASRQAISISFAVDTSSGVDLIAQIAQAEFPDLVPDQRHPDGRAVFRFPEDDGDAEVGAAGLHDDEPEPDLTRNVRLGELARQVSGALDGQTFEDVAFVLTRMLAFGLVTSALPGRLQHSLEDVTDLLRLQVEMIDRSRRVSNDG